MQVVFVSQSQNNQGHSASRSGGKELNPFPGKDNMPMNLLLLPIHFELLFLLMQRLSDMKGQEVTPKSTKAQILSR